MDETLLSHVVEENIADLSLVQGGHVRTHRHALTTFTFTACQMLHGKAHKFPQSLTKCKVRISFEPGLGGYTQYMHYGPCVFRTSH